MIHLYKFFFDAKRIAFCLLCILMFAFLAVQAQRKNVAKNSPSTSGNVAKFALLVGVNEYADPKIPKIRGAVNDVEDMRQALIDLYGFESDEIVLLKDKAATRQAFLDNFKKHLLENAAKNPNAVIFLHYSGTGTQLPDQNDDEVDGKDEVLIFSDSLLESQTNLIIDDDFEQMLAELLKHTKNVTVVYDSCHGLEEIKAKNLQTEDAARAKLMSTSPVNSKPESERSNPLPGLVIINAALPNQLADERIYGEAGAKKTNGVLTFNLISQLRKTPIATYRDIIQRVSTQVQEGKRNQTPNTVGDIDKLFLGGIGKTYAVEKVLGNRITINAGTLQGLKKDVRLALYKPQTKNFLNYKNKLTEAVVVEVAENSAVAEVKSKVIVPVSAKALLVASKNAEPFRVAFDENSLASAETVVNELFEQLNTIEMAMVGDISVETLLRQAVVAKTANTSEKQTASDEKIQTDFDLVVVAGKFGAVFGKIKPQLETLKTEELPDDSQDIFYLAGRDGQPLYGFFVQAADAEAAKRIVQTIRQASTQLTLKRLYKDASPLNGALEVSLMRVEGEEKMSGLFKPKAETPITAVENSKTTFHLNYGEVFRLKIRNNSRERIYLTAMNLGADGGVNVFQQPKKTARTRGSDVLVLAEEEGNFLRPEEIYISPIFRATGLAGEDVFKFIGSTEPLDFSSVSRGVEIILEETRKQKKEEWGTIQVSLLVSEPSSEKKVLSERIVKTVDKNLHILAIGIDEHRDPNRKLRFSVKDATEMTKAFEERGGEIYNVRTHLLLNDKATRKDIEEAFTKIIAEAQPDDVFVFYNPTYDYTGKENVDGTAEWFILPQDVVPENSKTDWRRNSISGDLLRSWVSSIEARNQILIFDSSPAALERFVSRLSADQKVAATMLRKNFVVFGGNGVESSEFNHAEFTYYLLKGLGGEAYSESTPNQINQITVRDMHDFLRKQKSQQSGSRLFRSFSIGDDFTLGFVPPEKFRDVGKDEKLPSEIKPLKRTGKDYALLIATDTYDDKFDGKRGFKELNNPVRDAEELERVLKDKYDFEVELLKNKTLKEIRLAIETKYLKLGSGDDQLFIFFAGHGNYDKELGDGGVAVKDSNADDINTYLTWDYIQRRFVKANSKHILLVIDVCYSGTFFKPLFEPERDPPRGRTQAHADYYAERIKFTTRKALASSADVPVSDGRLGGHSPFATALLNVFKNEKNEGMIRFLDLEGSVYGVGKQSGVGGNFAKGSAGGDFFFVPKQPEP